MMLVFGGVSGWVAFERKKNAELQADIDAIRNLGGKLSFEDIEIVRSIWLQLVIGDNAFRNVSAVTFTGTEITDAGLEHLKSLSQLKTLELYDTNITDAGLEHLKGLKQLEKLSLYHTRITDTGLANLLKHLPNCGLTKTTRLSDRFEDDKK